MNDNFDKALAFVLKWEGGYSNDPDDPGGETNFGIDKRSHPNIDVKNLTIDQAREIYKTEYWFNCDCQRKEWPLDIIVFDTAVNMGQKRAGILYQENPIWQDFLIARIAYYLKISDKTKGKFLKGWMNRVVDLYGTIKKGS